MTARPPFDDDALSPEERALAARLSALDAGGPSPSIDARILGAARAAVGSETSPAAAPEPTAGAGPAPRPSAPVTPARPGPGPGRRGAPPARRRIRRWPTAVGAAATLVIAVGLAWQLKPLIDMPPPLRRVPVAAAATEAEVLARAEPVAPRSAAAAEAASTDAAAPAAARGPAARVPAPAAPARSRIAEAASPPASASRSPAPAASEDYLDEAVGDQADAIAAAAAAPPPPPGAPMRLAEEQATPQAEELDRVTTTGSRLRAAPTASDTITVSGTRLFPPVQADAALAPIDWLQRIRDRRDAGHVEDARASLRRFVREYPRHRLPDDLRVLLAAPR